MKGRQDDDPSMTIFLFIFLAIFAMFAVGYYYRTNSGPINSVLVSFNRAHLYVISYLPGDMGDEAAYAYFKLAEKNPAEFSFHQIVSQFSYVGKYVRWIVCPVIGAFLVWGVVSKRRISEYYKREFTMQTLVENNVKEFPCMAPIANRKKSLLKEPLDEGKWRTPRQPIQFVAENKLLFDGKDKPIPKKHFINRDGTANLRSRLLKKNNNKDVALDVSRARKLFIEQLGPTFTGIDALPDYMQGLVAAFLAYGGGGRDKAQAMLDQMSLSFVEPENEGDDFDIDITGADKLIEQYKNDEELEYTVKHHESYVYPWLMALYEDFAKRKGVLPSSQFIWLRPVNNCLFCALNQMGKREPWIEAAGPWAHYQAENQAEQRIEKPHVEEAVVGLKSYMINDGWMQEPKKRFNIGQGRRSNG